MTADSPDLDATLAATRDPPAPSRSPAITRMGRYLLLTRLGEGGMGIVYAAYDPELDRKVAIKLLRDHAADAEASLRLQREAQAMARLSDPHCVAIYDVGIHDTQVYIAMEFVDGCSLGEWLRSERPQRDQIIAAFLAAGRGLAAAHASGIVHRDFKPDNVLRDRSGRIRVTDFGLARAEIPTTPLATAASGVTLASSPLTEAGAVLGTPAYMAPEQVMGRPADAKADQFSFCVALYEALYGQRPYRADNLVDLAMRLQSGEVGPAPPHTRVPTWLRRVLLRGLATAPRDRYETMESLLRALQADPGRSRRRALAIVGVVAVGGAVIGGRELERRRDLVACEQAGGLDDLWHEDAARGIEGAILGTGLGYASDVWEHARADLASYADALRTERTELCRAEVDDADADEALARRACWADRRDAFSATVEGLGSVDEPTLVRVGDAITNLPLVSDCADPRTSALSSRPTDPVMQADVDGVESTLNRAAALERLGRRADANVLAQEALAAAQQLDWPSSLARAELVAGRLAGALGEHVEAKRLAEQAFSRALSVGADVTATEAATHLVRFTGHQLGRLDEAERWASLGQAVVQRASLDEDLAGAGLYSAMAALEQRRGDPKAGVALHGRALVIAEARLGRAHPRVATVLVNLANVALEAQDVDLAQSSVDRALEILEAARGVRHMSYGAALESKAKILRDRGEPAEALALLDRATPILAETIGTNSTSFAFTLTSRGNTLSQLHREDEAIDAHTRALAINEAAYGSEHDAVARDLINLASSRQAIGDLDRAESDVRRALVIQRKVFPGDHVEMAQALTVLGRIETDRGRTRDADATLAEARRMFGTTTGPIGEPYAECAALSSEVALALGRRAEALELAEASLALREAEGMRGEALGMSLAAVARALDRDRDRARVEDVAGRAIAILDVPPHRSSKLVDELRRLITRGSATESAVDPQ
jgi:tetratricopeptide (TPR) repeat protein